MIELDPLAVRLRWRQALGKDEPLGVAGEDLDFGAVIELRDGKIYKRREKVEPQP